MLLSHIHFGNTCILFCSLVQTAHWQNDSVPPPTRPPTTTHTTPSPSMAPSSALATQPTTTQLNARFSSEASSGSSIGASGGSSPKSSSSCGRQESLSDRAGVKSRGTVRGKAPHKHASNQAQSPSSPAIAAMRQGQHSLRRHGLSSASPRPHTHPTCPFPPTTWLQQPLELEGHLLHHLDHPLPAYAVGQQPPPPQLFTRPHLLATQQDWMVTPP